MGKIITEKDFWMCSSGAMPAPLQGTRKSNTKEGGGETYITVADTATLSTIDFGCTKSMLMTAILTAIIVVVAAVVISAFIVATGGAGLGLLALVAIGAGGGIVGGIIGMVEGNMKCGQKNAQVRHWSDSKGDLLLTNTPAITSDCVMTCDVGGIVKYAPNIKTWNDAYMQAGLSYFTTFLECALGGAGIGLLGGLGASAFTSVSGVATLSQSVALTLPTWSSIGINLGIMGAAKGASGYNQYQRGDAWGLSEEQKWDMAIPEKEAVKRIQENGYQSITLNDILLFGSDLIGPFINIKTAPSVAAAEARAAAQGKYSTDPSTTKAGTEEGTVNGQEPVAESSVSSSETSTENSANLKGEAFESNPTADPPGTFRDSNGKLRNPDGTYAKDPNATGGKTRTGDEYNRSMSERRKTLLRDADDPNADLTPEARQFIKDNNGNKVPEGYEVSHEEPLYTRSTNEGKSQIDVADNMKTQPKDTHRARHKICGDQYHEFGPTNKPKFLK